jgi:2-dehydro-3-deoxyphosphogluconate aldolase/(4S)-4-hydroxy-2-oxoglutarate aldolase
VWTAEQQPGGTLPNSGPVELDLTRNPIIPVVVIRDARRSRLLGEALVTGGIPVAEVTFRTVAAPDAIRAMSAVPGLLVGAGTVVDATQVDRAVEAGARFIVSPGFSPAVVRRAQLHGLPVFPGAVTPTEIMAALDLGLTTLKFFPASVYGGIAGLKALGAPFPHVRFIPTGGVSVDNLADYLALPNVAAVGGSWMVPQAAIESGDTATIVRLSAQAAAVAARFRPHPPTATP